MCPARGVECKPDCIGPVRVTTYFEELVEAEFLPDPTNEGFQLYKSASEVVCSRDISDTLVIEQNDIIVDEADVLGLYTQSREVNRNEPVRTIFITTITN